MHRYPAYRAKSELRNVQRRWMEQQLMQEKITVPIVDWIDYILGKHRPVIVDIGDQRDPEDVIVCSCGTPGRDQALETMYDKRYLIYSSHLLMILNKELYEKKLYENSDMR